MIFPLVCGAAALAADRCAKKAAREDRLPSSLLGGRVSLEHIENDGLAGSVCRGNRWLTHVLPCAAMATALAVLPADFTAQSRLAQTGVVLTLSGGASNLYDRLRWGRVTDMVRFPRAPGKLRHLVWNVADFALVLGVICTVIGLIQKK